MKRDPSFFALLIGACLTLSTPAWSSYSQLYVFGDSLSDSGNIWLATGGAIPPSPPYDQRLSNGPVAVERLANDLGLSLAPSLAGGNNYAFAGAATGNVTTASGPYDNYVAYAYSVPTLNGWTGIDKQVAGFSAAPPAGLDNALFVVWGGPNDLFLDPSAPTAVQAANNLSASLGTLIGLGAKHILVPSMLDLSRTPDGLAASPTEQAGLSLLSATFNSVLSTDLTALRTAHSDVQLYGFDTNAAFDSLLANAAAYGFTNTTDSCVDTGCFLTSGLADEYVFWDGVHPTTHTDQILGDMFAAAVPEPAIALQMLAGLLLVASVMALRQRAS